MRRALLVLLVCAACGGGGGGPPPVGLPVVIAASPAPNSAPGGPPTAIVITFNQAMDPVTINQRSFLLTWSGGDGSYNDGNEVTLQALTLTVQGPNVAVFDLSMLPPLPDEAYRLRLVGDGDDAIRSALGQLLDGDFDGEEGGDYVIFFKTSTVVRAMTPAPGASLTVPPPRIVVTLPTDVDPATVTADTFRLLASGGDTTFLDGDETEIAPAAVSALAPGVFAFDLGGALLAPDTYQVLLAGDAGGNALRLDGADDEVRVPATIDHRPGTGSWTVEAWVSVDDPALPAGILFCADGDFFNGWRLDHVPGEGFRFQVERGGLVSVSVGTDPAAGAWHHVAGVYDVAAGEVRIVIDGVLANTVPGTVGEIAPLADFVMGTGFGGRLDEVRLWSSARTAAEIARDRYRTVAVLANLRGYWKFDEEIGQALDDRSIFDHTAALGADFGVATDDPVRILSDALPRITDLDGNALDGTFEGTLPSGIGAPGRNFEAAFVVE